MSQPHPKHDPLSRQELDDLKARVDLAEVIRASGVELKKTGRNLMGCCPFHEGDRQPSLSVKGDLWKCFGCNAGGDVLTYLERQEKLEFPAALERLRALAGVAPLSVARTPSRVLPGQEPLPGGLGRSQLLERVARHYAESLRQSPEAQEYLASRGLGNPELWSVFGLGFCDGSLVVPAKGEVREALEQVGLVNREGREFFTGSVVVPLTHPELGTVGLYGRKIHPKARVPHLFLPGPKRGVLNWQGLKLSPERVILTESVLDALSVWAAGEKAVTCLYGVSGPHPDLDEALSRFAVREVGLCLDHDEPGQKAAQSLAQRLAARGLRTFFVALPPGSKDPNQVLVEQGPTALREALSPALPPAVPDSPPATEEAGPAAEEEGFRWTWEGLTVKAIPQPPFRSRVRVTLRVDRGPVTYRHTLELSSFRARSQAARDLAGRFGLEFSQAERFLLELLEVAERWVAAVKARQEEAQTGRLPAPPMSQAEREEALEFLRSPDLIERILADMEAMGTVGEDRAKLLAYLIGVSRKLERPLAGILGSQSGAGKSGITERVADLMPPEEVVFYTRMSPLALYNMAEDYLQRKLVVIEEREGAAGADYPIRALISQHKLVQTVTIRDPLTGQQRAQENEVLGPIAYLETTTSLRSVNHENATRCFEITLDESEEQTRRIHAWQRQRRLAWGSQELAQDSIRRRHHQAQRLLERAVVRIPFVEHLSFPTRWLRTRRDHERFLCLIEAVAFLHQFQRPGGVFEDGTRYLEASPADYRMAFDLAQQVLASTFHELSREGREVLEAAQDMLAEGGPRQGLEDLLFTRKELRLHTGWTNHRVRAGLDELKDLEYVELAEGSQGRTCYYRLLPGADSAARLDPMADLTHPDQLDALLLNP